MRNAQCALARFEGEGLLPRGTMTNVRIKLACVPSSFAEVDIVESDTVSRLAERACSKFPSWKTDATQVSLFLVPPERARAIELDYSAASDLLRGDPLFSSDLLAVAGVAPSSFLIVRRYADGDRAGQQDSSNQRNVTGGQQLHNYESRALLSPLSTQVALVSAQHWLAVAVLRVGGSLFFFPSREESGAVYRLRDAVHHTSGGLRDDKPLVEGGSVPRRTLSFGVADGMEGAPMKEE